jgi:hypothetical protein
MVRPGVVLLSSLLVLASATLAQKSIVVRSESA